MQRKRVFWSSWILNECNLSCKIVKSCRIISVLFSGKIYRLKQHFLPPAIAWRFTKIKKKMFVCLFVFLSCGPVRFSQGNGWIYEKVLKYTQFFFFFGGLRILEREPIEDRVKLLESNALNCWAIMKKITHESVV